MGHLDTGRDQIDHAVRDAGLAFLEGAIKAAGKWLPTDVREVASKHGIDPGYIFFTLLKHRSSWARERSMVALSVAVKLYVLSGVNAPRKFDIPDADQEYLVDEALQELEQEAASDFVNVMAHVMVREGKKYGKDIQQAMADLYGKSVSSTHAHGILLNELPLRVKDHSYWFPHHVVLYQALGLLIFR